MIESVFISTVCSNAARPAQPPSQFLPFRAHQRALTCYRWAGVLRESGNKGEALVVDDVADVTEMLVGVANACRGMR